MSIDYSQEREPKIPPPKIFDADFYPISVHLDGHNEVDGADLLLRLDGKSYVLRVETYALNARRALEEREGEGDDDPTLVISAENIQLSDYRDIKNKPFAELEPFLVEQEEIV